MTSPVQAAERPAAQARRVDARLEIPNGPSPAVAWSGLFGQPPRESMRRLLSPRANDSSTPTPATRCDCPPGKTRDSRCCWLESKSLNALTFIVISPARYKPPNALPLRRGGVTPASIFGMASYPPSYSSGLFGQPARGHIDRSLAHPRSVTARRPSPSCAVIACSRQTCNSHRC